MLPGGQLLFRELLPDERVARHQGGYKPIFNQSSVTMPSMTDDQPTMESILQTLREAYEREETEKRLVKVALAIVSLSTAALIVFFSTALVS
jgi:hypothetical protein